MKSKNRTTEDDRTNYVDTDGNQLRGYNKKTFAEIEAIRRPIDGTLHLLKEDLLKQLASFKSHVESGWFSHVLRDMDAFVKLIQLGENINKFVDGLGASESELRSAMSWEEYRLQVEKVQRPPK